MKEQLEMAWERGRDYGLLIGQTGGLFVGIAIGFGLFALISPR